MRCRPAVMCCVLAVLCSVARGSLGSSYNDRQYLNEWAVEIPGGLAAAEAIAKELDYHLVRQVGGNTRAKSKMIIIHHVFPGSFNALGGKKTSGSSSLTIFRHYQMQQLKLCVIE